MSDEIKKYITADGQVFETLVEMGDINPKDYSLYHLEMAEKRVLKGTNKNIRAALGSTRAIAEKNASRGSSYSNKSIDEYGIDRSVYSKADVEFLHNKIREYKEDYKATTPFERETILNMAKTSLKLNKLEGKMMSSDDKKLADQYATLR